MQRGAGVFEINCRSSLKCSDNKTSLTHTALIYQNQFIHMTASVWAHYGKNRYVKQCKKKYYKGETNSSGGD